MKSPILSVRNVSKIFGTQCSKCLESTGSENGRNTCPHCGAVVALGGVNFDLAPGESLGIVGESGSGKSTLVKNLFFDQEVTSGSAIFSEGKAKPIDLFEQNASQKRWLRNHKFGMVYQNPHLGLNFDFTVGGNIAERLLAGGMRHFGDIRSMIDDYLHRVEIPAGRVDGLPSEFSGGMQQRVQIARALITSPSLLFLDEVTTGLDLSVQARILDLILELRYELDVSMLIVTHDLGVVRLLADRIIVMEKGSVVESGLTDQVLHDPQHPYTQKLVSSEI